MTSVPCMSHVRRIAIIGAGNAGVTTAKYLLAEKRFSQIDIFEQRDRVGGLWNYSAEDGQQESTRMPQTTADAPVEEPIWRQGPGQRKTDPIFVSPMYERLEANLPKMIMKHCDMSFPEECPLFPTRPQILDYLERYAADIRPLIHFETQIIDIRPEATSPTVWKVTTKKLGTTQHDVRDYDAVVVATGNYNVPYVPDIEGVREWHEMHPGTMAHSKHFRKPEAYKGKRTLLIGRGPSGIDMASQIAQYCVQPLLISTRSPSKLPITSPHDQRPDITHLDPSTRAVHFSDGTSAPPIDAILFCTGYLYSHPFLNASALSATHPNHPITTPDGLRPHNLHRYLFYGADPSLTFMCVPQKIVPFPIADAQAAVVARVWAGRLDAPSEEEARMWEEETVKRKGEGRRWLLLDSPEDGEYLNALADWADQARVGEALPGHVRCSKDGVDVGDDSTVEAPVHGKAPARWSKKDFWIRQRIWDIRRAYAELGDKRHGVRSLEEVGFDYEAWKREEIDKQSK